ncbi:MAG: glycosyltransferase [Actinomycetota bacterium]
MMDKEKTVSVILQVMLHNWYLYKLTINCIQNLRYFTYPYEVELILVHNQSQLFPEIQNELTEDDIYLPQKGVNLRLGKGINLGIAQAHSDYLCILANDVMVHQDWYKYAKEAIDNDLLDIVIPWSDRTDAKEYLERMKRKEYINGQTFSGGAGNCSIFKRNTYEKIGLLDENLVLACDRDYNMRIAEKQVRVGNYLFSHITHLGSMTWENMTNNHDLFDWGDFDDNVYFMKKWGRNS